MNRTPKPSDIPVQNELIEQLQAELKTAKENNAKLLQEIADLKRALE